MSSNQTVRNRKGGPAGTPKTPSFPNGSSHLSTPTTSTSASLSRKTATQAQPRGSYRLAFAIITLLAFITRFWGISHPNQVVFDEVHFGKFASYYLQRTYFFDVHPPLGKLLFALMGWFVGYDGHYLFENIGESYVDNQVPYVAFRAMPALLGSLTVSTVFLIMWESDYGLPACVLSACLVLFDNAHIGQTRLILLDATLVFAMAVSMLAYVRFYKQRHQPFGRKWWKWLLLTGVALSCVISTKYVGVFSFVTIGSAVAIDLWDLLDVKRPGGPITLYRWGQHLFARAFGLITVPFIFYLFWFQVHFAILSRSGPGDDFMSPAFQETLSDNIMMAQSVGIRYFDVVTLRHKDTKAYLHSHPDRYPLRYEDGRVSSQGQQVTGYPHNDTNNHWQIIPHKESIDFLQPVRHMDVVKLRHVLTNTDLLTHDVASPYYPANQEFTTVSQEDSAGKRLNDTLFEIRIENGKEGQELRSMAGQLKLVHVPTKVGMWTATKPLPEWGFKQQEINGNKAITQASNIWFIEDLPQLPADHPRRDKVAKKPKSLPFFRKWTELQRAMFFHNNALTSSHPYASSPAQWPFMVRGVSFWTKNETREQIYFLGNPLGWWFTTCLLAVFVGIIAADQFAMRRGIDALDELWHKGARSHLYKSTGFFYLAWAMHYFPFFLMGRQLFLHHYLPAHLAASLVAGALVEFIFSVEDDETEGKPPSGSVPPTPKHQNFNNRSTREFRRLRAAAGQGMLLTWGAVLGIMTVILGSWWYFTPLTYGRPGLEVPQVVARKWLNYDLHFAK